jgi:diguanylate cyclase (GGDEF)-like protein
MIRFWVPALAAMVAGAAAHAQDGRRFAVAAWGTEDGLASNLALAVRQTPEGFLWLATYEGLVRFDGHTFRTFAEGEIPGIRRASFQRLAVDRDGALWAASEAGGVVRHAGGEWRVFTARDGLSSDHVTALFPDADGSVWVGTRAGVSRIADGRVAHLPIPGTPSVTALARGRDGALWMGTVAGGVLRLRAGILTRFGRASGLGDDRVTALGVDRDGTVWVGTFGGVARIRGDRVERLTRGARPAPVNDLLQDGEGAWWLAADNGVFRLEGDSVVPVVRPGGEPFTQVQGLTRDREGSVWAGSRQGGLFRLREAGVRMLTRREGLPHDFANAVTGDGDGGVWIGTRGGAVHRTGDGRVAFRGVPPGDPVVRDLLRGRTGDVWLATNGGLARLRDARAERLTTRDGLPDDRARVLLEDRDGALWVGTSNGLARWAGGRFTRFGRADGLPDGYVLSLHQDRRGTVWVGTQSAGLFRLQDGRFVSGPAELAGIPVFRMADDPDGTLWVGTARGLARVRGARVARFGAREGLHGNTVFQALDDGAGSLWLTGPWGIARVARRELDAVADGRARTVHAKGFGVADGLVAREVSSIGRSWRGEDGALYFPTPAGVARIHPHQLPRNRVPPVAHVERVVADGRELPAGASLDAGPGRHRVEIGFTAPSFVAPDELRFRYRLEGFDPEWVNAGTRRTAIYTNVPPGRYTFRVQARNEDGVWGTPAAPLRLTLRPHFWETAWFLALCALAALGAALGLHALRVRAAEAASRVALLREMSLRDELTGLYNRRGLVVMAEKQMEVAARQGVGFGVLFVDLDRLKEINDTLGHTEGDQALRDSAALLRATFRESDVVARIGGDEFAVLLLGRRHADVSERGTDRAVARLNAAIERDTAGTRRPYTLSMSIGASRFDPASPEPLESVLERADRLMYAHKRARMPARG